jgi:hypothetical protein
MRRLAVGLMLVAGCLPLTGCRYFVAGIHYNQRQSLLERAADSQAAANITAAQPAIEGYHARHGTYEGLTVGRLRAEAKVWVVQGIRFVRLGQNSYCVQSTAEGETWSSRGPWGDVVDRPC